MTTVEQLYTDANQERADIRALCRQIKDRLDVPGTYARLALLSPDVMKPVMTLLDMMVAQDQAAQSSLLQRLDRLERLIQPDTLARLDTLILKAQQPRKPWWRR